MSVSTVLVCVQGIWAVKPERHSETLLPLLLWPQGSWGKSSHFKSSIEGDINPSSVPYFCPYQWISDHKWTVREVRCSLPMFCILIFDLAIHPMYSDSITLCFFVSTESNKKEGEHDTFHTLQTYIKYAEVLHCSSIYVVIPSIPPPIPVCRLLSKRYNCVINHTQQKWKQIRGFSVLADQKKTHCTVSD